jgi:hypothetical protein
LTAVSALPGEKLADVAEAYLLSLGDRALSLTQLEHAVRQELELPTTNFMFAVQQMKWRATVLGAAYPFVLSETAMTRRVQGNTPTYYVALLFLSPSVSSRLGPWPVDSSAITFERLVCVALERLLGEGAQALRFGWPYEDGRPEHFPDAIRWAAEKMRIRVGAGYRQPRRRDGGVDIIAWRPFPDGRPGFPIALVQCTVEEDVVGKSRDIDLRLWSTWLGFDTTPISVLAVPSTVARNEDWNEVATNCILLDRLRLMSLCSTATDEPRRELIDFADNVLAVGRRRIVPR